jgi:hypothetical protein
MRLARRLANKGRNHFRKTENLIFKTETMTPLTILEKNYESGQPLVERLLQSLHYAAQDVDRQLSALLQIVQNSPSAKTQLKAFRFLRKQNTLKKVLEDLTKRIQVFKETYFNEVSKRHLNNIISQFKDFALETEIFNEMHFRVKKSYVAFLNRHGNASSQLSFTSIAA